MPTLIIDDLEAGPGQLNLLLEKLSTVDDTTQSLLLLRHRDKISKEDESCQQLSL
jgi:hypothetical protein